MPARTNEFQRLVALLTKTLAGVATVTESEMLLDKVTGRPREVDVYVVSSAASYDVRLGIEVVSWGRPADVAWVERMWAKHQNLPTDKLILVAENGFTVSAKEKAEFYGVEALTVDQACDVDWPAVAAMGSSGRFEKITMHYQAEAICKLEDGATVQRVMRNEVPIGTTGVCIDDLMRGLLSDEGFRDVVHSKLVDGQMHDYWLAIPLQNGFLGADVDGVHGHVTELRISLKVLKTATPVDVESGKFRSSQFISGTSTTAPTDFQFVLMKGASGDVHGVLHEGGVVLPLSVFPTGERG